MHRPSKILVPVDLSPRSEQAVAYAAMLAEPLGSGLVMMTNLNLPERATLEELPEFEGLPIEEAGRLRLRQLADELAPGIDVSIVVSAFDFPADGILAVIDAEEAEMVVIASHGRSGMTRWLLGSVAEKIARASRVPVVIVPVRERT